MNHFNSQNSSSWSRSLTATKLSADAFRIKLQLFWRTSGAMTETTVSSQSMSSTCLTNFRQMFKSKFSESSCSKTSFSNLEEFSGSEKSKAARWTGSGRPHKKDSIPSQPRDDPISFSRRLAGKGSENTRSTTGTTRRMRASWSSCSETSNCGRLMQRRSFCRSWRSATRWFSSSRAGTISGTR